MITLLTGLPGNGKGVYGLDWLKRKAESENRVVYYSGINDCRIPGWVELDDPQQWYKCPAGSYILIDECQRIFRTRANGSAVPPHVSELETHRHNGLDLVLITQHPMLIDQNIRRLVGQHFHIVRKFGMQAAVVHEWNQVNENPTKTRRGSIKKDYKFNKEIYGLYKSAELHTVKRNIPASYYVIGIVPFIFIALMYFAWQQLNPDNIGERVAENVGATIPGQTQTGQITPAQAAPVQLSWYEQQEPRVPDLPHTAPKYDDVTKPDKAPLPSACVLMRGECRCYTQQATRMKTDDAVCRQIVENGFFVDFDDKPIAKDNAAAQKLTNYQNVLRPEAP